MRNIVCAFVIVAGSAGAVSLDAPDAYYDGVIDREGKLVYWKELGVLDLNGVKWPLRIGFDSDGGESLLAGCSWSVPFFESKLIIKDRRKGVVILPCGKQMYIYSAAGNGEFVNVLDSGWKVIVKGKSANLKGYDWDLKYENGMLVSMSQPRDNGRGNILIEWKRREDGRVTDVLSNGKSVMLCTYKENVAVLKSKSMNIAFRSQKISDYGALFVDEEKSKGGSILAEVVKKGEKGLNFKYGAGKLDGYDGVTSWLQVGDQRRYFWGAKDELIRGVAFGSKKEPIWRYKIKPNGGKNRAQVFKFQVGKASKEFPFLGKHYYHLDMAKGVRTEVFEDSAKVTKYTKVGNVFQSGKASEVWSYEGCVPHQNGFREDKDVLKIMEYKAAYDSKGKVIREWDSRFVYPVVDGNKKLELAKRHDINKAALKRKYDEIVASIHTNVSAKSQLLDFYMKDRDYTNAILVAKQMYKDKKQFFEWCKRITPMRLDLNDGEKFEKIKKYDSYIKKYSK